MAAVVNEAHHRAMRRSTGWRVLEAADLKPHKSVYWLNRHDVDVDAKAPAIGGLYLDAPRLYQQGRLVICCDEQTGMQILQRAAPTRPTRPGKPQRREHEYVRHGTRVLFASLAVATGQVAWTLERRRTSADFLLHVHDTVETCPAMERYDWVVDNLNSHWSLDLCAPLQPHPPTSAARPRLVQPPAQAVRPRLVPAAPLPPPTRPLTGQELTKWTSSRKHVGPVLPWQRVHQSSS